MGSVALDTGTETYGLSPVSDPSDLNLTRGNLDEEEEEADNNTDYIERKAMIHQCSRILCNTNGTVLEEKQ